jgi:hypothetical protein
MIPSLEEDFDDELVVVAAGELLDAEGAAGESPESASVNVYLHLGQRIAWFAITIPQSGHFFIVINLLRPHM